MRKTPPSAPSASPSQLSAGDRFTETPPDITPQMLYMLFTEHMSRRREEEQEARVRHLQIKEIFERYQEIRTRIEKLERTQVGFDELVGQKSMFERKMSELSFQLTELQTATRKTDDLLSRQSCSQSVLEGIVKQLDTEFRHLEQQNRGAEDCVKRLDTDVRKLEKQSHATEASVTRLETEFHAFEPQGRTTGDRVTRLETEFHALEKQSHATEASVTRLETEFQDFTKEGPATDDSMKRLEEEFRNSEK
jgi:chromosome segregation ATPase